MYLRLSVATHISLWRVTVASSVMFFDFSFSSSAVHLILRFRHFSSHENYIQCINNVSFRGNARASVLDSIFLEKNSLPFDNVSKMAMVKDRSVACVCSLLFLRCASSLCRCSILCNMCGKNRQQPVCILTFLVHEFINNNNNNVAPFERGTRIIKKR